MFYGVLQCVVGIRCPSISGGVQTMGVLGVIGGGPFSKLGYSVLGRNCGSSHRALPLLFACLLGWFSFTSFLGVVLGGVAVCCHHSS